MARDYSREFRSRNQRAQAAGFASYGHMRKAARYGLTGSSTPGVRPRSERRIHDAVGYEPDFAQDWQEHSFTSTRVDRARYSSSRRELQVFWTNAPPGVPYPPYVYDAVDPATWSNFILSGSAGRYVEQLNSFPYRPAPEIMGEF